MNYTVSDITALIPAEVDLASMVQFILIFAAGTLLLGFLGRAAFGKRSDLNHAVSSAMGIFFIYALTVVIYTFNPYDLSRYLSPLPFVTLYGDSIGVFSFTGAQIPAVCNQVLSMVILAFLVNLLDTLIPKGKKIISWYLFRFLTVVLSMAAHYVAEWAFNTYLPGVMITYAPIILLAVLAFTLLLGVLKLVLGLVLTAVNPIIGAIYTFFFANKIGKQLTKAVLSTIILCAVVYVLNYFGYTLIAIGASSLGAYVPLMIVLLVLWYLIGHVL